jgi:hypothetical protein
MIGSIQRKKRHGLTYGDMNALPLEESDFVSGGINRDSFIRGFKLFTGSEALILGIAEISSRF